MMLPTSSAIDEKLRAQSTERSRLQMDINTLMKPDQGFVFSPVSQSVLHLGCLLACLPWEDAAPHEELMQLQLSMEQRLSCHQSTLVVMPQLQAWPRQDQQICRNRLRPMGAEPALSAWQSYLPLSTLTYRAIQGQPGLGPKGLHLSPQGLPHVSKICCCLWGRDED